MGSKPTARLVSWGAFSVTLLCPVLGCATAGPLLKPSRETRQAYIQHHHDLAPEVQQAIFEGRVIKGMTKEEVRISWGEPTQTEDFSTNKDAWWYDEYGEGWWYKPFPLSLEPTRFVKFQGGIVDYVSEQYK